MIRGAGRAIPVRFSFPEPELRLDGWGRLLELRAGSAVLSTRFEPARGGRLSLDFELFGKRFEALEADVVRVRRDADGYAVCELRLRDGPRRLLLGRTLAALEAGRP